MVAINRDLFWRSLPLEHRIHVARNRRRGEDRSASEGFISECRSWFSGTDWKRFLSIQGITECDLAALQQVRSVPLLDSRHFAQVLDVCLETSQTRQDSLEEQIDNAVDTLSERAHREWTDSADKKKLRMFHPNAVSALRESLACRLTLTADALVRSQQRHRVGLMGIYPVLGRLWAAQIADWLRFVDDFAMQSLSFIRRVIGNESTRAAIEALRLDLSDPHFGGRTVVEVHFRNGLRFFYKPRSGLYEYEWFRMLRWLNAEGFKPSFFTLDVHTEQDHCWTEAFPGESTARAKRKSGYYFRAGALLFLTHLFRGTDLHSENVLTNGLDLVLVDCETLAHPTAGPMSRDEAEESIERTGFLPRRGHDQREFPPGAGCGLGVRAPLSAAKVTEVICGGRAARSFVTATARRRRHLSAIARRLHGRVGRRIYRPSAVYYEILLSSTQPYLLMDGLSRSLYLWASCLPGLSDDNIVAKEVTELERLDFPVFYGRSGRSALDFSEAAFVQSEHVIRHCLSRRRR